MLCHKDTGMRMPFFVQKNKDEEDFYYLGDLTAIPDKFVETTMPGKDLSVVRMECLLDREVDHRLYKYLTKE